MLLGTLQMPRIFSILDLIMVACVLGGWALGAQQAGSGLAVSGLAAASRTVLRKNVRHP